MKGERRPGLEPDKGDEDLHGRGQGFHRVPLLRDDKRDVA